MTRPNRIAEFRRRAGLSQEALAGAAGTSRSQIVKLERGERRLTLDWMVRLATALGADPKDLLPDTDGTPAERQGLAEPAYPFLGFLPASLNARPVDIGPPDLPVRGRAQGGEGALIFPDDLPPADWTYRPPQLRGVPDAFAVFASGESMRPMYRPGQILWIHPNMPLVPGEGILVVKRDDHALIKEFVRWTASELVVREYCPAERELAIAIDAIRRTYRIVGAHSLR
jgi:phage repressor protein C with HTH and peptisase S24 domain